MELMPQNVDIYVKAAHTNVLLGNAAGALEVLKKVEKQFYDNTAFLKELAVIEYKLGDTSKAQRDFNRFCENGGRDAEVFLDLGSIHENKGELTKARECYEKAQLIEPDNTEVREKLNGLMVKPNLAEKTPGQKDEEGGGTGPSSPGTGHGRIMLQIGSGVLCLGGVAAGILMDRQLASQYTSYQASRNVAETQSLHTQIEQKSLYRNVLYAAGGVLGLGCGVTFFIPSKR
jgi:tetratricopeptide (TPR) repeat protein